MPRTASAPTLEQQIVTLQTEIADFESELEKTQTALAALEDLLSNKISPQNSSPAAISQSALKITEARLKNQPKIDGFKRAIEQLQSGLQTRRQTLSLLQRQQIDQTKQEKMQTAIVAVREHIDRINDLSALLEAQLWALKATWQEHREAFINGQSNPWADSNGHGYRWQPAELVIFGSASVPNLVETSNGFRLQQRDVGLFSPERQRAAAEEIQRHLKVERARQETGKQAKRQRFESMIEMLQGRIAPLKQELERDEPLPGANDYIARKRIEAELEKLEQELHEYQRLLAEIDGSDTIEATS